MPETPTTYNYYPALSELMTAEELPEILGFIRDGLQQIFDKVYYKNFYASVNSVYIASLENYKRGGLKNISIYC